MEIENVAWLKHLEDVIPSEGYGNKLSMYLIALEAWRRGIKVNFFTIDNPENKLFVRYSLEYGGKAHRFESSRGDRLTKEAYEICENKDMTKRYLANAGLKVPKGKRFDVNVDPHEITEYATSLSFPVVVKPLSENAGKGVFSNIDSKASLLETINHLKNDLGYLDILVEEYIPGIEYRVLTINGKVRGAVNRIPANVIGNGADTILELINKKNESRLLNPNISKKKIKIDREILHSINYNGYELDSILREGEQLFLRTKSNVSTGGDPVDITDELPNEIKDTAEKAAKAIPGLDMGGLDIIIDPDSGDPTIIEINTKPMIGLHVFPVKGRSRDVVKPIVDMYFPETKNLEKSNLYFDFEAILAPLDNAVVKHIEVKPPEIAGRLYSRQFLIYSQEIGGAYRKWVRLSALKLGIHGYIKRMSAGFYEIIAASKDIETMEEFKSHCNTGPEGFEILGLKELQWDKSVSVGFKIRRETSEELKQKIKKEKESRIYEEKKLQTLEKKLDTQLVKKQELMRTVRELKEGRKEQREKIKRLREDKREIELKLQKVQEQFKNTEDDLTKEIRHIEQERKVLRKRYNNIVNSRSWKLTQPLRKYNLLGRSNKNH